MVDRGIHGGAESHVRGSRCKLELDEVPAVKCCRYLVADLTQSRGRER